MEGQVVQIMQDKPVFNKKLAIITAIAVGLAGIITLILTHAAGAPVAFSSASEWNNPLPANAPLSSANAAIISELKSFPSGDTSPNIVMNAGFSNPIYYPTTTDKAYAIKSTGGTLPPELGSLRIPKGAKPATGSDGEMMIWDNNKGYVVGLHAAVYDSTNDTWSANGADVYYTASNGLNKSLPESNDSRNVGHRGYPSAIAQVRYDEIQAGAVNHVLKVALDETGECHYYPGSGNESGKGGNICEGQILRIKPSVDLSQRNLTPAARIIATAMQKYGVVVGDTGGNNMALKLENISYTHPDLSWSSVGLTNSSLSAIKWDDFEAIAPNYHRPISSTTDTTAPAVPSGLSATASDSKVALKWTATSASDLSGYNVQYKPSSASTWTVSPLIGGSTTSYSVSNLTNGQDYNFQVRAVDTSGNYSGWSASVNATPTAPTPTADTQAPTVTMTVPTNGSSVQGVTSLTANAGDNVGVSKVDFYVSGQSTPVGTATTAASGTPLSGAWTIRWDSTANTSNGSYALTAKAYDAAGNGPTTSAPVTVNIANTTTVPTTNNPPTTPQGLKTSAGDAKVALSWTANQEPENDLKGYDVQWQLSGAATWSGPASVTAPQTNYTVSGLVDGLTYDFRIRATDNAGNVSAWSASVPATPIASTTVDNIDPSPVKTMTATAKSGTEVDVAWSAATDNLGGSGVVKYKLFRHDPNETKRHLLAEVMAPATSFTDLSVSPGTKYFYAVDPVDAAGNVGSDGPRPSVTTPALATTPPTAPSSLTATASGTTVNLGWTASTSSAGLSGYYVYRSTGSTSASVIAKLSASTLSYADSAVSSGNTYSYYVKAVDVTGQLGAASPVQTVSIASTGTVTDTKAPSTPRNLTATEAVATTAGVQINLTWDASNDGRDGTGVKGYYVFRNGAKVATVTGTSYGDLIAVPSSRYTYSVEAFDGATPPNVSLPSKVITVFLLSGLK